MLPCPGRQRIWGSLSMTQSFMGDKACWLEHMALNSTTGLDPDGVKLRASEGLFGVDYFFPGYAVWAKIIEAAADLGYDSNNLVGHPPRLSAGMNPTCSGFRSAVRRQLLLVPAVL
jgi:hypothetical protein